jgi:hypothetical protein
MTAALSSPISFACPATALLPPGVRGPAFDAAAPDRAEIVASARRTPSRPASLPLKVARHCGLATRFQAWSGRSGRRYVVSIHAPQAVPDFSEAVLLAVAVDETGGPRLLGVRTSEQGLSDWPALARADEVHVHLLARSAAERDAAAADLCV